MLTFSQKLNLKDFKNNILNRNFRPGNLDQMVFFSKSSWSLFFLIEAIKKLKNKDIILMLPEYYCDYVLRLCKKTNSKIYFYRIKDNFSFDLEDMELNLIKYQPDALLFVNYFDKNYQNQEILNLCHKYNCLLIRDSTHQIIKNFNNNFGDFTIYSPHKFFPIPVGSILLVNTENKSILNISDKQFILSTLKEVSFIDQKLKEINFKKKNYLYIFFWFIKKFFFNFGLKFPKNLNFDEDLKINQNSFRFIGPKISKININLMLNYINNFEKSIYVRKKNFLFWKLFFKTHINSVDFDLNELNNYAIVIRFKNNFDAKKIFFELIKKKIPVTTWPDLPDEIKNNQNYPISNLLRNSCLFVNLHHKINDLPIEYLNKSSESQILEISEYNKNKDDLSNLQNFKLLQSLPYGNAVKKTYKLNIHRYVIKKNNKILAFFQILEKKILFFKIRKLNQGPIYLKNLTDEDRKQIVKKIIEKERINNLSIFKISPNLSLNYLNIVMEGKNNFIWENKGFSSSIIDLNKNLDEINKNMKQKWRNSLNKSIKFSEKIKLEKKNSKKDLYELIEDYKNFSKIKKFKKINTKLIINMFNENIINIYNAYKNNYKIASFAVSQYKDTATYLIGINSEEGRKLNINYYVIWKVIEEMKLKGLKYFDTGGLDESENASVYKFKSGLNGKIYNLVGDKLIF